MKTHFLLSKSAKWILLGFLTAGGLMTTFSNCSNAKFGILESSDQNNSLDNGNDSQDGMLQNGIQCPANQVALGLKSDGTVLCSNLITRNDDQCASDEAAFSLSDNPLQISCYKISDTETTGATVCPPNFFLTGLDSGNTISCTPVPVVQIPLTCPIAEYIQGRNNSSAICLPANNQILDGLCPNGQVITRIENNQAVCEDLGLSTLDGLSCPAGSALVGNNSLTCQEHMTLPSNDQTCPQGQMAIAVSDTSINCAIPPAQDFSHFCPQGLFLSSITNGKLNCEFTPNNVFINSSCPPGHFISGFQSGLPICEPGTLANDVRNSCPSGFVPVAISNGQFVCTPLPQNQSSQCVPLSQVPCVVANGFGAQTCAVDGSSFGSCEALVCQSGFEVQNGQCVEKAPLACIPGSQNLCTVTNGFGAQTCAVNGSGFGSCQTITCHPGFKFDNGSCITDPTLSCLPGSQVSCAVANGTGAQVCAADGQSLGSCNAISCNSGFQLSNGQCIANAGVCTPNFQQVCSITNGLGVQVCAADGSAFGSCTAQACFPGFNLQNGQCVPSSCAAGLTFQNGQCVDISGPDIVITQQPSNPTSDSNATVAFTVNDPSGVSETTCFFLDQAFPNCTSPFTQQNLPPGSYELEIRAKDSLGQQSIKKVPWVISTCISGETQSCSVQNGQGTKACLNDGSGFGSCVASSCDPGFFPFQNLCLDRTPPTLTINSQPPVTTSSTSATFTFSAVDNESGLKGFGCSLNGAPFTTCTSPKTVNVGTGTQRMSIIAFDNVHNTSRKDITWTVTAPQVDCQLKTISGISCNRWGFCTTPKLNICNLIPNLKPGDRFTITSDVSGSHWVYNSNTNIRSHTFTFGVAKTDTVSSQGSKRNVNSRVYDGNCLVHGVSQYQGKSSKSKNAAIRLTKAQAVCQ